MKGRSPRETIELFKDFLRNNRERFYALRIIFEKPYGRRGLTLPQTEELARALMAPPYNLTYGALWRAYKKQDNARVRGTSPDRHAPNIIPLVGYATGEADLLEPYIDTVTKRYNKWVYEQEELGRKFDEEQTRWLNALKNHIGTRLSIKKSELDQGAFKEMGGIAKAKHVFSGKIEEIIKELNEILSS